MAKIIGRKEEQNELQRLYESDRPEFVAVYGRRRVGKTFLVRGKGSISSSSPPFITESIL